MQDFSIIWENVVIEILVNDDINNYKNLPIANLYYNGKLLANQEVVYINKYINYTNIDTVITTKLGKYYVYYKAIFPGYDLDSIVKVEFNVVDIYSPVLKTKELNVRLNSEIDIIELLDYSDNYDLKSDIKVEIDQKYVDYTKVGNQYFRVYLTDTSNNQSYYDLKLNIYDNEYPQVIITDNIIIDLNSNYSDILDYLIIEDNDKLNEIDISFLDDIKFIEEGYYKVRLKATDYSLNSLIIDLDVEVKDMTPPTIKLKEDYLELDEIDSRILLDNIKELEDNYSHVSFNILPYEISSYTNIVYEAFDESNNVSYAYLTVHLNDYKPYFISNDLVLDEFISNEVLYNDIKSYDYDNTNLTEYIKLIDHNIENKEGIYYAYYQTMGKLDYNIYERKVIIEKKDDYQDYFIFVIPVIIVLLIISFILYKLKSKKRFKI